MTAQDILNALNTATFGGKTASITPVVTTTAVPYTAGDVIGGPIRLQDAFRAKNGTAILKSIFIKDDLAQNAALSILFYNALPVAVVDNAPFAWGTGDFAKCIGKINIAVGDYETFAAKSVADLDTVNQILQGANNQNDLWIVIVTTGTPTYGANPTTLIPTFNFLQD